MGELLRNALAEFHAVALMLLALGIMQQLKKFLMQVEYEGELNDWLNKGVHVVRLALEVFSANDSEAEDDRIRL